MRFLLFLFLITVPLSAQVVLSEIMFDPEGKDSPNEFVEIYNLSDEGTVDLSEWKISDRYSLDDFVDVGAGFQLLPRSFALIMEGDYDIAAGLYSSLIPDSALLLKVDDNSIGNGLGNSADSLYLIDEFGHAVDSVGWEDVSASGFSLERKRLDLPGVSENWATSLDSLGTPGFLNSVTPPEIDVAIDDRTVHHSPVYPTRNETMTLFASVHNLGIQTVGGSVRVFEYGETLGSSPFENLMYGDSVTIAVTLRFFTPGIHALIVAAEVAGDSEPGNDMARHTVVVQFAERVLTINEFHYAPDPGVPEFIELVNLSEGDLNLGGWRFSDSDTAVKRRFPDYVIPSGGYVVVAEDSATSSALPFQNNILFPDEGFPSLNNSGDAIYLFDPTATLMDSLVYGPDWGGAEGRSVEKLNPELGSPTKSNWGTCVAPEKMTPGAKNSIFLESIPSPASISIQPNPFSPDGDRQDDILYISYNLPFAQAYLTILIFDSMGRTVRTLAKNLATGSHGTVRWEGMTDRGRRARIGIYVVKITALQALTQKKMEWVKTAVLAEPLR